MHNEASGNEPARIITCPTCRKRMQWSTSNAFRPFCSDRCRLIDLGSWADESHRIPGSTDYDDLLSGDVTDSATE